MKYEYMSYHSPIDETEEVFIGKLNEFGKEGWKVITIIVSSLGIVSAFLEKSISA